MHPQRVKPTALSRDDYMEALDQIPQDTPAPLTADERALIQNIPADRLARMVYERFSGELYQPTDQLVDETIFVLGIHACIVEAMPLATQLPYLLCILANATQQGIIMPVYTAEDLTDNPLQ